MGSMTSQILWKIKNVPNHQPDNIYRFITSTIVGFISRQYLYRMISITIMVVYGFIIIIVVGDKTNIHYMYII